MWSAESRRVVARSLVLAGLWLASAGGPLALSDAGPHVHYGWGESIRLRHLYTSGPHGPSSCFLRIRADGAVDCARGQSALSESLPGPPSCSATLPPFTSFDSRGHPTPEMRQLSSIVPSLEPGIAPEPGGGGTTA